MFKDILTKKIDFGLKLFILTIFQILKYISIPKIIFY